jgi:hypothetical protein
MVRGNCSIFQLEAVLLVSKGDLHSDNDKLNDIVITTEQSKPLLAYEHFYHAVVICVSLFI